MRVLNGRAANLSHEFLDEETPLPQSAVTVTVTDMLGAQAAQGAATLNADGVTWQYAIPAASLSLGTYTVSWAGDTATDGDSFEVVGNFLFSVPEARKADEYLADAVAWPASDMVAKREMVEREFEQICHRSFTQRARVIEYVVDENSTTEVLGLLPDTQELLSLTVNGVAVTDLAPYGITTSGSVFIRGGNTGANVGPYSWLYFGSSAVPPWRRGDDIRAVVRYGLPTVPADLKRVAMIRLRNTLAQEMSGIPDRATTWQPAEGGTFRLATPGKGGSETGIPEVDAVLARYTLDALVGVYALA